MRGKDESNRQGPFVITCCSNNTNNILFDGLVCLISQIDLTKMNEKNHRNRDDWEWKNNS